MTFFPLDRGILTSSIWAESSPAELKVWIYLLLSADPRTGIVPDADPAIAVHCGLELVEVARALSRFEEPDRYSRTETLEGRRIERVKGRIRIINYTKHKDKDYSTPRVKRWRERQHETVKRVSKRSTVTETTNTNKNTNTEPTTTPGEIDTFPQDSDVWWDTSLPGTGELMCSPGFASEMDQTYPTIPREKIREEWLKFSMMLADPKKPNRLENLIKNGGLADWVKARIREDFARLLARPENVDERAADMESNRRRRST